MTHPLVTIVRDHVSVGCRHVDHWLGIQRMPVGYALMLDADGMYFFWVCQDGITSVQHWNKWAIWRGAMMRSRETAQSDRLPTEPA